MEIQEAIQHCREVADGYTEQGKCPGCAADHKQLADWLEELVVFRTNCPNVEELAYIKGLVLADRDGRLVVLPCKVGDPYFSVEKFCDEHGELDSLQEHSGGDCEFCCIPCNAELRVAEHKFWNIQSILDRKGCIGKTVFLTRQEAEAALRKEGDHG